MNDVEQIKEKTDIVSLVGEYVQLKPAGVNHKGLCPFHREKSPSFMVNAERQRWHCFGCSKGGDVISFIQEIEGMDFIEALKLLADRAGIQLTLRQSQKDQSQKARVKEINAAAAHFFHNMLIQMDASKDARAYLEDRGLTKETIAEWQIGFIPEQWDLLTKYLLKKGFAIDDLVAAGLTIKKENARPGSNRGYYDRFRGRIMFPIWDAHDNVVGFTGRVLVETEKSGGKYVNTPQTIVFDKSRVVFGLNKAKKAIREEGYIIMVEGQMDVIAVSQFGMKHVVATSGTAMTESHVTLLKRYATNIRVAFDADDAGRAAAKRGIDLARAAGVHVQVIQIPEGKGKDPDECIKEFPDVWKQSVENAKDIMDWYLEKACAGKDIGNPRDKQQVADEVLPEIAQIPFAVERDHWLQELGGRLGVDIAVLREDLARIEKAKKKPPTPRTPASQEPQPKKVQEKKTRFDMLLQRFFSLGFTKPTLLPDEWAQAIRPVCEGESTGLYESLKTIYTDPSSSSRELFSDTATHFVMQAGHLFGDLTDEQVKAELAQLVRQIRREWIAEKRKTLANKIAQAERSGNIAELTTLLEKLQSLTDA